MTASEAFVLVVEDNAVNFELTKFLLENMGLSVCRAAAGEQALSIVSERVPALVVMDIQLPGMDGLETTRRLRARPETSRTPIIGLSALAMASDREQALAAGCDAYLTKPFNLAELQETVLRYLDGHAADQVS